MNTKGVGVYLIAGFAGAILAGLIAPTLAGLLGSSQSNAA